MKIYACANWGQKFCGLLIDYWREQGHEVEFSMGYDEKLHRDSEVCFVDACDNNAVVASGNRFPGSRLAVRVIDIEAWVGQPGGVQWDNVDACIFGAQHIERHVRSYVQFPKTVQVRHIPFGVDMRQWTYRDHAPNRGKNIACVCHRWYAKGVQLILQVVHRAYEFGWDGTIHFVGTPSNEPWLHKYIEQMVHRLSINATFETSVEDMDAWLEPMDYAIIGDMKNSFSYAVAEAAAKGIKPLVHSYYGAYDIWPENWIWETVGEAAMMLMGPVYNSPSYRQYVEDNYALPKIMGEINAVCGIE